MAKQKHPGRIIVTEGSDGAGKQTVSTELYETLIYRGYQAILISFPRYYTTPGREIRKVLDGAWTGNKKESDPLYFQKIDPIAFGALYAWDRNDAKPMLVDWLKKGRIVVIDRYVRSNQAHQGARRQGADRAKIIQHYENLEYGLYELPVPDLNIFLDLPVLHSMEAMKSQRRKTDVNEKSLLYQNEVRKIFRHLHSQQPSSKNIIIPCVNKKGERRSRQEIADKVWNAVNERILSKL